MKIIAGALKGKPIVSPHTRRTHPMSDRVRGGLFNVLGDLSGLTVLDALAGTGALGFEAISRGAQSVVAVELDKQAQKAIAETIVALNLNNVAFYRANIKAWLRRNRDVDFDIVLCDPPYDDVDPELLRNLAARVKSDGVLVVSWPGKEKPMVFGGFRQVQLKSYGDAQLVFYRRTK